jgi:hypothetical protein
MKGLSKTLLMSALLAAPIAMAACSETVYHKEQSRENLDGSRTKTQTTVRENPDGTTTTDTTKVRVRD